MREGKIFITSVMLTAIAIGTGLIFVSGVGSAFADPTSWKWCEEKPNSRCCCYGKNFTNCRMKYIEDCKRTLGNPLFPKYSGPPPRGVVQCERCWE